jgi:hypothetical protein
MRKAGAVPGCRYLVAVRLFCVQVIHSHFNRSEVSGTRIIMARNVQSGPEASQPRFSTLPLHRCLKSPPDTAHFRARADSSPPLCRPGTQSAKGSIGTPAGPKTLPPGPQLRWIKLGRVDKQPQLIIACRSSLLMHCAVRRLLPAIAKVLASTTWPVLIRVQRNDRCSAEP